MTLLIEEEIIDSLRDRASKYYGYVDQNLSLSDQEKQKKGIKRLWEISFYKRYGFTPFIEGAIIHPYAYIRRFTFDKLMGEIIEFMEDGLTKKVILFLKDDGKSKKKTKSISFYDSFNDAEVYLANWMKRRLAYASHAV